MRRLLEDYWVLTSKAPKGVFRELGLLGHIGMHFERMLLLRLMYALETGLDCGDPGRGSIHELSDVARRVAAARPDAIELLGAALDSRDAIRRQIERQHEAASALGRQLAERLGFAYPDAAAQAARDAWSRFTRTL